MSSSDLDNQLVSIYKNLNEQTEAYQQLLELEKDKRDAIIDRAGFALQNLSQKEETLIHNLDKKESLRVNAVSRLATVLSRDVPENITALLKWPEIDPSIKVKIESSANELKGIVQSLREFSTSNQVLLSDSQEFFQALISAVSIEESVAYGTEGSTKTKTKKAIIVDAQV